MSEQPSEPAPNKRSIQKLILILLVIAGGLFLLGFAIDKSARSKDEAIGAILPMLLGIVLIVIDVVLLFVLLVRRRRNIPR